MFCSFANLSILWWINQFDQMTKTKDDIKILFCGVFLMNFDMNLI